MKTVKYHDVYERDEEREGPEDEATAWSFGVYTVAGTRSVWRILEVTTEGISDRHRRGTLRTENSLLFGRGKGSRLIESGVF